MNEQQLAIFKEWLQEQSSSADKRYMDAAERSRAENYHLGASDAFDDVIYQLEKLLNG